MVYLFVVMLNCHSLFTGPHSTMRRELAHAKDTKVAKEQQKRVWFRNLMAVVSCFKLVKGPGLRKALLCALCALCVRLICGY